ncbi:MAG TPA: response regulator transcription factor [Candidatus Limnocylindrales bacterium]|nr:response regulator transcription factor [Candidatus Limnocylindrales bacterium]
MTTQDPGPARDDVPASDGAGMPPRRVLIVDDEPGIVEFVRIGLEPEGFDVIDAATASAGLARVRDRAPDLVIVDVGLPDRSGFELLSQIRAESQVPVVMLTARGDVEDRVRGLDLGADDYVAKPFHFAELLARVKAHLRRQPTAADRDAVLKLADLTLDPRSRDVRRGDRAIELTAREFELLELFLRNPGRVLSKESILDRLWGYAFDDNLVEVYVGYLRRKLGEPDVIHTYRGAGYALREPA